MSLIRTDLRFLAAVVRLALAAAALAVLCRLWLHPRPELVRVPSCPTLVGDTLTDFCAAAPQRVTLDVGDPALPACTPQQAAMLLPGFTPTNCMKRRG